MKKLREHFLFLDYQPSYKIKLAIQTLENGCIWVNDNTGADPMEVCAPETVYIQSHNATVTRNSNNITFSLEFALISNKDLGKNLYL